MKNLYKVKVKYTDGTSEILRLKAESMQEAEVMAQGWTELHKVVEDISVIGELKARKGSKV